MRLTKAHHRIWRLGVLLLCLATCPRGQEGLQGPGQRARQLADAANDNPISLEDRQESLRKLEEAVALFISTGETLEAARAMNRVGRLQLLLHQPQEAVVSYSKALELVKDSPGEEAEVDSLNGLGGAYLLLEKKKEDAENNLRKAILLSKQSGYITGQAEALLTLSESQNTYDHALALQTAQEALALWQSLDDKRGLARAFSQIGQYFLAQNELPESTENYEQALKLWRDLKNPSEQAEALVSLGYIEHRAGEWSSAISFYTQAQGLLNESAEPQRMGEIAAGLAAAFSENGLPELALIHYQRALDYYQQAQNTSYVADATFRIGKTYYLLGNYPEALARFKQALALVQKDTIEGQCEEYLGRVYMATGEYEAAARHLKSALRIYTQAFNPKEAARVQALMGQIAEGQRQPAQARRYYQAALSAFVKLSDRVNQAAVYYALGGLELKNHDDDAAENYLRQSVAVTENIRRLSKSSDLTAAFSAAVYDRYEKYIECLMRRHDKHPSEGFDRRAFEASELARARSLTELLQATGTNLVPDVDPQLAAREKSLRQALRVGEDYKVALLSKAYSKEELDALEAKLAMLEAEYKQVTETIQVRYPSYGRITKPSALDLEDIQKQVVADDQTVLLEYSLGADKSYLWAVTRDHLTSYELPRRAQIEELAQKVYKILSTPPGASGEEELIAATGELGRMLLSPAAAQLNRHRFIIVADGILNYIPFQVLPVSGLTNEPLVSSHEVVNSPSASVLGELRQEAALRRPAPRLLAAFGDPVFASNFAQRQDANKSGEVAAAQTLDQEQWRYALRDIEPRDDSFDHSAIGPLFYAKHELANLSDLAGDEAFVATGFEATKEKLQSTDLTKFAILHFATHAILDSRRPENSGLLLSMVDRDGRAQNGFVGLQDIYNLRAPVDLVVLSACQTGLGKEVRGEGLIGLTRGFMYAGASTVVATLWKVDDEATADLMKRFYSNLLQRSMTPAEALRAAQDSVRREGRSPYYWAAFTLQGEYRQVIKTATASPQPRYTKIAVGGALLAMLGGATWLYRRRRATQGLAAIR